jgi:hypothetical protein
MLPCFLKIASLLTGKCSRNARIPSLRCFLGKDGIPIFGSARGLELDMHRGLHITRVAYD